jgi:hypothetical protein
MNGVDSARAALRQHTTVDGVESLSADELQALATAGMDALESYRDCTLAVQAENEACRSSITAEEYDARMATVSLEDTILMRKALIHYILVVVYPWLLPGVGVHLHGRGRGRDSPLVSYLWEHPLPSLITHPKDALPPLGEAAKRLHALIISWDEGRQYVAPLLLSDLVAIQSQLVCTQVLQQQHYMVIPTDASPATVIQPHRREGTNEDEREEKKEEEEETATAKRQWQVLIDEEVRNDGLLLMSLIPLIKGDGRAAVPHAVGRFIAGTLSQVLALHPRALSALMSQMGYHRISVVIMLVCQRPTASIISEEQYVHGIGRQLLHLCRASQLKRFDSTSQEWSAMLLLLGKFLQRWPLLAGPACGRYLWPVLSECAGFAHLPSAIDASALRVDVERLHAMLHDIPASARLPLCNYALRFTPVLTAWLTLLQRGTSGTTSAVMEVLQQIFAHATDAQRLISRHFLVLTDESDASDASDASPSHNQALSTSWLEDGQLLLSAVDPAEVVEHLQQRCRTLCTILAHKICATCCSGVFLSLLETFRDCVAEENDGQKKKRGSDGASVLDEIGQQSGSKDEESDIFFRARTTHYYDETKEAEARERRRILVPCMLSLEALTDLCSENLLGTGAQSVGLASYIVESSLAQGDDDSLGAALGLFLWLGTVCALQEDAALRSALIDAMPLLQRVSQEAGEAEAADLARGILVTILSLPVFEREEGDPVKSKSEDKNKNNASRDKAGKAVPLPEQDALVGPQAAEGLELIRSTCLPLRSMGIQLIGKALRAKETFPIPPADICQLLLLQFSYGEDYLFQPAIGAMTALATRELDLVMRALMAMYVEEDRSPAVRLKVGEALLRTLRAQSPQSIQRYLHPCLRTLVWCLAHAHRPFSLARLGLAAQDTWHNATSSTVEEDPLLLQQNWSLDYLRASALANMAQLCSVAGPWACEIHEEVLNVVSDALRLDASAEVRAAAADVLGALNIEPGRLVHLAYRRLLEARDKESEPAVLDHLYRAIGYYNSIIASAGMRVLQ